MVIYDDGNREIWSGKQFLGDGKTNNVAEYNGLVTGLECAVRLGIEKLRVRGDSDLVIKQVTGDWQCHKQHLKVLLQRALDERRKFKEFGIAHVKRDNNKRADQLANAAMNERVTNLGFAPAPSLGTPNLSQESDIVDICAKQQPTQTMTCNTFDDQDLDLKLSFLQMPTSPHKEVAAVNSSAAAQVGNVVRCCGTFDDEPLEEELMTFQIPDTVQKEIPDNGWLSGLSFLARFEVERIGLQHNQSLKDAISNIDITNTNDAISAIYNEIKSPDNSAASSSPTYNHFLKHCLANELKVDEGNSCLFLFHAKFTSKGLELLPPEPADVKTRRIHRRFGSHRFLDLHIDEKWKLPTLKDNMKKIFTDNKVIIAGRRYAILYSNTYEMPVIFRLFAESGVGIENDVSVTEVASCCIPPALNPQLSLTKYMKRMQLNFTGSIPSLVLAEGELEAIDDICGFDDNIMTDGCGLISSEALDQVWITYCDNLEQRKRDLGRSVQSECIRRPTSFQGRIGGIKGMFVLDSSLEGVKVQYRPSQVRRH
jgi:ribonuclease HI